MAKDLHDDEDLAALLRIIDEAGIRVPMRFVAFDLMAHRFPRCPHDKRCERPRQLREPDLHAPGGRQRRESAENLTRPLIACVGDIPGNTPRANALKACGGELPCPALIHSLQESLPVQTKRADDQTGNPGKPLRTKLGRAEWHDGKRPQHKIRASSMSRGWTWWHPRGPESVGRDEPAPGTGHDAEELRRDDRPRGGQGAPGLGGDGGAGLALGRRARRRAHEGRRMTPGTVVTD